MIEAELLASGIFTKMRKEEEDFNAELKYLIKPTIKRMEWYVPNNKEIQDNFLMFAILTGVVGALIYSSTDVDIYGHVDLEIELYDLQNDKSLFTEIFYGEVKKRLSKFSYDSVGTKSEMIGLATQDAIEKFKEKLKAIF